MCARPGFAFRWYLSALRATPAALRAETPGIRPWLSKSPIQRNTRPFGFLASSSNAGPASSAAIASRATRTVTAGCVGSTPPPALRPPALLRSSPDTLDPETLENESPPSPPPPPRAKKDPRNDASSSNPPALVEDPSSAGGSPSLDRSTDPANPEPYAPRSGEWIEPPPPAPARRENEDPDPESPAESPGPGLRESRRLYAESKLPRLRADPGPEGPFGNPACAEAAEPEASGPYPSAPPPDCATSAASPRSAISRNRSHSLARVSGVAASGASAAICGAQTTAHCAAANWSRASSSALDSTPALVPRAYSTVPSMNASRCFATASLPPRPGAAYAAAPDDARRRWSRARCARSSRSALARSNGVPTAPAAREEGDAPPPPLSAAWSGASADKSRGAASGGTRASTEAAAAACAPPSRRQGTRSANSDARDPRAPSGVVRTGNAVARSGFGGMPADSGGCAVPGTAWFSAFDARSSASVGLAAHTKHVQFLHASNLAESGSVGARGRTGTARFAALALAPSCIIVAWTRCSACALAVVVTSGLAVAARAASAPSAEVHAPPRVCRATAEGPPVAAADAADAAESPLGVVVGGRSARGEEDEGDPGAASPVRWPSDAASAGRSSPPRALHIMSPAHASRIALIEGGAPRASRSEPGPGPFPPSSDPPPPAAAVPASTTPPERLSAAANAATSFSMSTAAARTLGEGLHRSKSPALSGRSVPSEAAGPGPVPAASGGFDGESASTRARSASSATAPRHTAHTSLSVVRADAATAASVRLMPACAAPGGRSSVAAAPCTTASRLAGSAFTARRIASPAASRTAGCGCAHRGGTASPSAFPRHSSGAMNGMHLSRLTATATDASSVGFASCNARAVAPSWRRSARPSPDAVDAASIAARFSAALASAPGAGLDPATRSAKPASGSNPPSRIPVRIPARPGSTGARPRTRPPPPAANLGAVRRMMSGTAVSPAAAAAVAFPSRSKSNTTSALRSGSRRDTAAVALATLRVSAASLGPFFTPAAAAASAALSLVRVTSGSGGAEGAGAAPPRGSGGAMPSTMHRSASVAGARNLGSLNALSSIVSMNACMPSPPSPPHSASAACKAPRRGNPAGACFFSFPLIQRVASSRHVATARAHSRGPEPEPAEPAW